MTIGNRFDILHKLARTKARERAERTLKTIQRRNAQRKGIARGERARKTAKIPKSLASKDVKD